MSQQGQQPQQMDPIQMLALGLVSEMGAMKSLQIALSIAHLVGGMQIHGEMTEELKKRMEHLRTCALNAEKSLSKIHAEPSRLYLPGSRLT